MFWVITIILYICVLRFSIASLEFTSFGGCVCRISELRAEEIEHHGLADLAKRSKDTYKTVDKSLHSIQNLI